MWKGALAFNLFFIFMKLKTLIEELQKVLDENWNIECLIQHRDYGWHYSWKDEPIIEVEDNTIIL